LNSSWDSKAVEAVKAVKAIKVIEAKVPPLKGVRGM